MRQSTDRQVRENLESQRLQRELQVLARELGWRRVEVLEQDLGCVSVRAPRSSRLDRVSDAGMLAACDESDLERARRGATTCPAGIGRPWHCRPRAA